MTYPDTLDWMFSQLPMYQRQGKVAYKADLSNTILLANHLNNPQKNFKSIHVAGTNGKGSTCHLLASIFQEAGYKVGLYTSPHLKDFRERIKLNGKPVSKQFVINFIKRNKEFFEANNLSFFEMTVGMAFEYFSKKEVDIAIVEVGLGGRLDSTNIITPEVSVITNIGLDHTQFLGNTIETIAFEKAGIIKTNIPVVIGEIQKETKPIFEKIAKNRDTNISFADQNIEIAFESDLKGQYQSKNIKTVLETIIVLNRLGFHISDKQSKLGLRHVVRNTGLLGRWQVLQNDPKVICDTAHNKEGLILTMSQLLKENFKKLHLVLGFVNDKDLESIINLFPREATYYFCKPNISRGFEAEKLKHIFQDKGFQGEHYNSVKEAMATALKKANNEDVVYVGGSTFVVAEII